MQNQNQNKNQSQNQNQNQNQNQSQARNQSQNRTCNASEHQNSYANTDMVGKQPSPRNHLNVTPENKTDGFDEWNQRAGMRARDNGTRD